MIDKLLAVKNVGIFDNLRIDTDTWNKEFKKLNLIYAENGQGKTTLSVIFQSIKKGKPELLIGRKTLGVTGEQKIKLISGNRQIIFENNAWNELIPDIEIFNSRFITENVYVGDTINAEQKRNLHQYVLGEEGVSLVQQINELDGKIRPINNEIQHLSKILQTHIKGTRSIDEFVSLQHIKNLEEQIQQNEITFRNIEQIEEVLNHQELIELDVPLPPLSDVKKLLATNYDQISREAEQLVNKHLESLNNKIARNWIEQGLTLTQRDRCPFCGSDLLGNELVRAYKQYFDKKYREYREKLFSEFSRVEQYLSEQHIFELRNAITTNTREAQYWREKIDSFSVSIIDEQLISALGKLVINLRSLLELKKSDILTSVQFPPETEEYFNKVYALLKEYQQFITENNRKISDFKRKLATTDKEEVIKRLEELYLVRKRYEAEIQDICEEYERYKMDKKQLSDMKSNLQQQLDSYVKDFKNIFTDKLNTILGRFGAGFRIYDIDTDYRGGPKFEFRLSINRQPVVLNDSKGRDTVPQFKNTLSEGDKSTLAFAFFIAKLYLSENLEDKIIIVDDPICSLDIHRVHMTAIVLSELADRVKQIFILTHSPMFAQKLVDQTQRKCEVVTLEIRDKTIKRVDIDKLQLSDYFINYYILDDYVNGKSTEREISVARAMRPLLEAHYRMHFPKHFTCGKWLGDFIQMVKDSTDDKPYYYLKDSILPELEAINEYSKQYHHDTNPGADSVPISPIELRNFACIAIKLCS